MPVIKFETEEEAVAMANDTEYGLASYFYTTVRPPPPPSVPLSSAAPPLLQFAYASTSLGISPLSFTPPPPTSARVPLEDARVPQLCRPSIDSSLFHFRPCQSRVMLCHR